MQNTANSIESLFERVEAYGKTTIELSKLKALEATTRVVAALTARLTVVLFISLFLLVMNLGIALWLGDILGKIYYGFFIVGGFYLVTGIILHFCLHKWIKGPLTRLIIKQVLQ